MRSFTIGTINLNGARDSKKRMMLFQFLKLRRIDVCFVQETHSTGDNEIDWKKEWEGFSVLSHKSSVSGGVAVLFSKTSVPLHQEVVEVVKGRCLKVVAKFDGVTVVFLNIYAPILGPERVAFLNTISDILKGLDTNDLLFLGGDFNCTENHNLDRNHLEPHSASQRALIQLTETHDLCDIWRNLHEKARQYTWVHSTGNHFSLARLDRLYTFKHQISSKVMHNISC